MSDGENNNEDIDRFDEMFGAVGETRDIDNQGEDIDLSQLTSLPSGMTISNPVYTVNPIQDDTQGQGETELLNFEGGLSAEDQAFIDNFPDQSNNENGGESQPTDDQPSSDQPSTSNQEPTPINNPIPRKRIVKIDEAVREKALNGFGNLVNKRVQKIRKESAPEPSGFAVDEPDDGESNIKANTTYSILDSLEKTIRGSPENDGKWMPGSTCGDRMDKFLRPDNVLSSLESKCMRNAMQICANRNRIEKLRTGIKTQSAEQLQAKDYEVVHMAQAEASYYRSKLGKAFNALARVQSKGFKKKTDKKKIAGGEEVSGDEIGDRRKQKGKYSEEVDVFGRKQKVTEESNKQRRKKSQDNDDDEEDVEAGQTTVTLTQAQQDLKTLIENSIAGTRKAYKSSIEDITNWAIEDSNVNYLIPDDVVGTGALTLWRDEITKAVEWTDTNDPEYSFAFQAEGIDGVFDVNVGRSISSEAGSIILVQIDLSTFLPKQSRTSGNTVYHVAVLDTDPGALFNTTLDGSLGNRIQSIDENASKNVIYISGASILEYQNHITKRKQEVMLRLIRDRFNNVSQGVSEEGSDVDLTQITEYDPSQQPSTKRIKTLKINVGTLGSCQMYQYSYDLVNPLSSLEPLKRSLALAGVNQQSIALTLSNYSKHYYDEKISQLSKHYGAMLNNPSWKLWVKGMIMAGIIPPPLTQATYSVQGDEKTIGDCHMLMWPDRLAWSYDGIKDITNQPGESTKGPRTVIYSDLLDPYYRVWRQTEDIGQGLIVYSKLHEYIASTLSTKTVNQRWNQIRTTPIAKDKNLFLFSSRGNITPKYKPSPDGTPATTLVDEELEKYESVLHFYQQLYSNTFMQRISGDMDQYNPLFGEHSFVGRKDTWRDLFSQDQNLKTLDVCPSEYTFYTENGVGRGNNPITKGSFVLLKEWVCPYMISSKKLTSDSAGAALQMLLVANPKKPNPNIWFKTTNKLRKGKKSKKSEKMITRWEGLYTKMIELEAICENGLIHQNSWDHPEWMLLMFKSIASFIYKLGEEEATKYLFVIRLNKLQKFFGNTTQAETNKVEQRIVYLLRKYLDFGLCVDNTISGDAEKKKEPMYDTLVYDYVMFKRKWLYSTVEKSDDGSVDYKMHVQATDPTEPWLIRPIPTLSELWKLFQYYNQQYFQQSFQADYIRSFYDFVYADQNMSSSNLKSLTEPGKELNSKRDFQPETLDALEPNSRNTFKETYINFNRYGAERYKGLISDKTFRHNFGTRTADTSDNLSNDSFNISQVDDEDAIIQGVARLSVQTDTTDNDNDEDDGRDRALALDLAKASLQDTTVRKRVPTKRQPTLNSSNNTRKKTAVKISAPSEQSDTTSKGDGLLFRIPKYAWRYGTYESRIEMATDYQSLKRLKKDPTRISVGLLVPTNVTEESLVERMSQRLERWIREYKSKTGNSAIPQEGILYMLDEAILKYVPPIDVPLDMYTQLTEAQKYRLAILRRTNVQEFNRVVRQGIRLRSNKAAKNKFVFYYEESDENNNGNSNNAVKLLWKETMPNHIEIFTRKSDYIYDEQAVLSGKLAIVPDSVVSRFVSAFIPISREVFYNCPAVHSDDQVVSRLVMIQYWMSNSFEAFNSVITKKLALDWKPFLPTLDNSELLTNGLTPIKIEQILPFIEFGSEWDIKPDATFEFIPEKKLLSETKAKYFVGRQTSGVSATKPRTRSSKKKTPKKSAKKDTNNNNNNTIQDETPVVENEKSIEQMLEDAFDIPAESREDDQSNEDGSEFDILSNQ